VGWVGLQDILVFRKITMFSSPHSISWRILQYLRWENSKLCTKDIYEANKYFWLLTFYIIKDNCLVKDGKIQVIWRIREILHTKKKKRNHKVMVKRTTLMEQSWSICLHIVKKAPLWKTIFVHIHIKILWICYQLLSSNEFV